MLINLKTQILPPIGIIGLGRSGLSAKKLLLVAGFVESDISTFDETAPEAQYQSREKILAEFFPKTLVVSPGFPLEDKLIKYWKGAGVKITSEINLATYFLTTEKIVGITGSLGKSTTTSLIGAGLQAVDKNAFIGGNLGTPFCEYALRIIENPHHKALWIALELSSYQLENSENLKLDYSIITYLTPNHLERYENLEHYYNSKWRIVSMTKNKVILNSHGGDLMSYAGNKFSEKIIWTSHKDPSLNKYNLNDSTIMGLHNLDNVALASKFIVLAQLNETCLVGIKSFGGLAHRLEVVKKTNNNILFINDSKATTIDSVITAIDSCLEKTEYNKIFVLIGGKDKKLPWLELKGKISHPRLEFLFFGANGNDIRKALSTDKPYFSTLNELLAQLPALISSNSIVLLSPGGTSHDEFKNFEERGEFFKKWIKTNYPI